MRFFRRPSCSGGCGGGSNDVFCCLPSGPSCTWKCWVFFTSPFRLIATCSFQVYCASACLFIADACFNSATFCCNSGFCATANRLKPAVIVSVPKVNREIRTTCLILSFISLASSLRKLFGYFCFGG